MEFLPTWRVAWEVFRYGKLLAPDSMVASFHRDWRFDRVIEAKRRRLPAVALQFKERADLLFPPSPVCAGVLLKLQTVYGKTVSSQWREDTDRFKPVMMELWGKSMGFEYPELLEWLRTDPKNHQIVLDTAKLTGWLEEFGLEGRKEEVVRELLPHTRELHYRFTGKIDRTIGLGPRLSDDSDDNLHFLISEMGYRGPVVAELGWPDVNEPIVGWRKDFSKLLKVHRKIVAFLESFR